MFSSLPSHGGRGRGTVLPSWMTSGQQGAPAPGSASGGSGDPGGPIRSVDDALAVLEAYGMKHRSSDKKRKRHKHKKEKKSKHKKEKKRRKDKDRRRRRSSSRSSGSTSSGSSGSDRDRD